MRRGRGGGGRGGWERKGEANCKDTRLATHVSLLIVTYIVWARGLHVLSLMIRALSLNFYKSYRISAALVWLNWWRNRSPPPASRSYSRIVGDLPLRLPSLLFTDI